jgi:hypothetical protein
MAVSVEEWEDRTLVRHTLLYAALIASSILLAQSPSAAQSGRTFYIDYSSGSNGNPGTQSAPWKTHPYMQTAASCTGSGNAPSYTHQAGDKFIFKGGVTWPSACFIMIIPAGGSSASNPDVYTTDQTWFNGGSFSRPIFDMQNNNGTYDPTINIVTTIAVHASNVLFGTPSVSNSGFDFRNLGITNFTHNQPGVCYVAVGIEQGGPAHLSNVMVSQSWFHAFYQPAPIPSASDGSPSYPYATGMATHANAGVSAGSNIILDHSEVSNMENTSGGQPAHVGMCAVNIGVQYSHCHDLLEGIRPFLFIHDTEINNINYPTDVQFMYPHSDPNQPLHLDTIQADTHTGDGDIYNNYIHDSGAYAGTMNVGCSDHVYNNVVAHVAQEFILMDPLDTPGCNAYVYNNTFDGSTSTNPTGQAAPRPCGDSTHGTVNFIAANNICIAGGGAMPSYKMSVTEANTYGFTSANKYAPTSSDPNLAGANLSSLCSTLTQLCSDTGGAPWYGGTYVSRGSSWNVGAFAAGSQTASSPPSHPNPPTSLSVSVQ